MKGSTYEIRARHVNQYGVAGDWSNVIENTIDGDTGPPGLSTGLEVHGGLGMLRAKWTNPTDSDYSYTQVVVGTTNDLDDANIAARISADAWESGGYLAGTRYYLWVRAVDKSHNVGQAVGAGGRHPDFVCRGISQHSAGGPARRLRIWARTATSISTKMA